jgi:uncharacterized glyoxalase superfamily protein PhnB
MPYKPEGYTSAAPYLLVRDAQATLDFLRTVFGAEELRVFPCPPEKGGIMHAEARIDDTVIMMGEMPDGPPANVHVYVPDAGAAFARALEAGGTVVQQPERKEDGDLRGGVRDVNGTTWWIATQQA